jgi:hypothetical protein
MTDVPSATCPAESHGDLTHASCLAGKQADRAVYVYASVSTRGSASTAGGRIGSGWTRTPGMCEASAAPSATGPAANLKGASKVDAADVREVPETTVIPVAEYEQLQRDRAERDQLLSDLAVISSIAARCDVTSRP